MNDKKENENTEENIENRVTIVEDIQKSVFLRQVINRLQMENWYRRQKWLEKKNKSNKDEKVKLNQNI